MWSVRVYIKNDPVGFSIVCLNILISILSVYIYLRANKIYVSYEDICKETTGMKMLRTINYFSIMVLVSLYTYRMYIMDKPKLETE